MAKRKDSVALFEVITAAKTKEAAAAAARAAAASGPAAAGPNVPSVLRTPKWWFKGKKQAGAGSDPAHSYVTPALPAPSAAENDPTQRPLVTTYDPTTPAPPAPGVVQRVTPATYTAATERVTIPAAAERPGLTVDPFGLDVPASPVEPKLPAKPRRSWLNIGGAKKVNVDPDRGEVTVRFRYTTAIVVGFALCVAVGLAYVTGRHNNDRAKAGTTGVSSDSVRRGPILAGVLDVGAADRSLSSNNGDADSRDGDTSHAQPPKDRVKTTPPATPPTGTGTQPKPTTPTNPKLPGEAAGVTTGLPRSIGLNYVVVQSYPDRKSADDAQKALEDAGIPSTVEKGLRDYAGPNFFCVVGTHGFSSYKTSPAYKSYVDSIAAVSKTYAGTSKYKKFDPTPYKWKAQ